MENCCLWMFLALSPTGAGVIADFWVRSVFGVITYGSSWSDDNRRFCIQSGVCLMCQLWDMKKCQLQPWSKRNFSTAVLLVLEGMLSSLETLTKFVLLSEWMSFTGPQIARKCHRPLMKLDVSRYSMSSMCSALTLMQVNIMAHLLLWAWLPLVGLATTVHGPKKTYILVNWVLVDTQSTERSAIFWVYGSPLSLRHVTHSWTTLQTWLLPPTIQYRAACISPSVKCHPWCRTFSWCHRTKSVTMWCFPGMIRGLLSSSWNLSDLLPLSGHQ